MRRRLAWIVAGVLVAGSVALNGIQLPGLPTTPSGGEEPVAIRPSTTPTSGATSAAQASPADRGGVVLLLGTGRAKHRATLSASGFGLLPREKIELERVTPEFPSTVLATGLTDQHGEFGGLSFKVPDAWPNGEQTVKIVGLTSKREAS